MAQMEDSTDPFVNAEEIISALERSMSTSKPTSSKDISYEALTLFQTVMVAFWYLICVSGIISNVINIRTFLRMGLGDSVTICFFFLALSDFSYCILAFFELTIWLAYLIDRLHGPFYFYATPIIIGFLILWIRKSFLISSILITTYMALQRCLCVVVPFHVRNLFTRFRTYCALIVIFSFSVTCHVIFLANHSVSVGLHPIFNASHFVLYLPSSDEPIVVLTEVVIGLGLNLGCMTIVVLCLVVMAVSLRKSVQFRKSATKMSETTKDNNDQQVQVKGSVQRENRALIQVGLISIIFVTTNLPLLGNGLANLILPELNLYGAYTNVYHLLQNIMFTTELLNSSINLVVYYRYNTKYKNCCFRSRK